MNRPVSVPHPFGGVDDNVAVARRLAIVRLNKLTRIQAFDVRIEDKTNPSGYVFVKRLKVGKWSSFSRNFKYGYAFSITPQENNNKFRTGVVDYSLLSIEDLTQFEGLVVSHGSASSIRDDRGLLLNIEDDLVWSGFPGRGGTIESLHTGLVAVTDWQQGFEEYLNLGTAGFTIEEVYYDRRV